MVILDGEARPAGGMGIARQAKDEIYHCPPIMVIIARRDDGWLATWSRADAVASQPIDPIALAEGVADLMRRRLEGPSATPTRLSLRSRPLPEGDPWTRVRPGPRCSAR